MGKLGLCRVLLSRLKDVAMERSWRTIMEGGLLEARQGNFKVARQIFGFLMEKVPLFGPIYAEAVNLELRLECYDRALRVAELGLERNPNYGPLWFLLLNVLTSHPISFEQRSVIYRSSNFSDLTSRLKPKLRCIVCLESSVRLSSLQAFPFSCAEWKLYYVLAQAHDRSNKLLEARSAFAKAVYNALLFRLSGRFGLVLLATTCWCS